MAVGVAFSAEDFINPLSLVIGIALHNIPEGLTIAISLVGANVSRIKAASTALLIGMVQPIGAIVGKLFLSAWLWPVVHSCLWLLMKFCRKLMALSAQQSLLLPSFSALFS